MQRSLKVSVDLSADVLLTYISCSNRQSKNARLLLVFVELALVLEGEFRTFEHALELKH